jgi:hypothetical protein
MPTQPWRRDGVSMLSHRRKLENALKRRVGPKTYTRLVNRILAIANDPQHKDQLEAAKYLVDKMTGKNRTIIDLNIETGISITDRLGIIKQIAGIVRPRNQIVEAQEAGQAALPAPAPGHPCDHGGGNEGGGSLADGVDEPKGEGLGDSPGGDREGISQLPD